MSNHKLVLVAGARKDVKNACIWYNESSNDVTNQFLDNMEKALQRIKRSPQIYPLVYESFRRVLVPDFPYAIFYKVNLRQVTVYAIMHTSRSPYEIHKRLM